MQCKKVENRPGNPSTRDIYSENKGEKDQFVKSGVGDL